MKKAQTLRWIDQLALAVAAGCCGVILYQALFPSFYYMAGFGLAMSLWVVVPTLALVAHLTRLAHPRDEARPASNARFIGAMLIVATVAVALKLPLYASFMMARPGLEEALAEHRDDLAWVSHASHDYGLYDIGSADRRCHRDDRIFFMFRNDSEAAIIYSESGIEDLCYNSGNKGHLLGNWYWMKED